jgi:ribosomal protein L31E
VKKILKLLKAGDEEILHEADCFYDIYSRLRYEGKAYRKGNLKRAFQVVNSLDKILKRHCRIHETAVFAFLIKHVPKLEPALHGLHAEHEEISEDRKKLASYLKRLSSDSGKSAESGIVYQFGICIAAFLRHHIALENKIIRNSLRNELYEGERRDLEKRIRACVRPRKKPLNV